MLIKNMVPLMAFKFSDDCGLLGDEFIKLMNEAWTVILVVIPVLLVVLIILDFVKAVAASDEKQINKAVSNAIKRVAIGVAIFFLPLLVDFILKLAGIASGTCSVG